MGNDCWYYRAQYAGMTKVCMRKSIVERCRIVRFGLCPIPPDSEAWRRCGFAIVAALVSGLLVYALK